jgi:hypothetical protein
MMKSLKADLQADLSLTYDKTKTSLIGKARQRTINGELVVGPPPTTLVDPFTTTAGVVSPSHVYYSDTTNRLFVLSTFSTNTARVLLYNFDKNTFQHTYVGRINITLGTGTQTPTGFAVHDTSATWNIMISTTSSVVTSGGLYEIWKVTAADFTSGGTDLTSAIANDAKAIYFMQDPAAVGAAHIVTTARGVSVPWYSSDASINTKSFVQNTVSVNPVFYAWDHDGIPNIVPYTVSAQTTAYAGTSPVAYFTTGAVNPLLVSTDALAFVTAGPSNFLVSNPTVHTPYYARDIQFVSGAYYFNLSTTATPGAAVVPATTVSNFSMVRGLGISTNQFQFKTGSLSPALVGTPLATNSIGHVVPTSVPANVSLNGQECLFLATNSNLFLARFSDITSGSVSWSSLTNVNLLGTGTDFTTPAAAIAQYSSVLDRWIYTTNTSRFAVKRHQNNQIDTMFGCLETSWMENTSRIAYQMGFTTITSLEIRDGILFVVGATAGQRAILACDASSDPLFDRSKVITKVLNTTGKDIRAVNMFQEIIEKSATKAVRYRTASTASDVLFNSASGGWISIDVQKDLNSVSLDNFTQFEIQSKTITDVFASPCQVKELIMDYVGIDEISDNWEGSVRNTSLDSASPTYIAFRLSEVYSTLPSKLVVRGTDDSGNVIFTFDTSVDISPFSQSNNNGTSWTALGSIGALHNVANTSEVRVQVAAPSGTNVTWSIREE